MGIYRIEGLEKMDSNVWLRAFEGDHALNLGWQEVDEMVRVCG